MKLKEKKQKCLQWQIKNSINQNMLEKHTVKGQQGITLLALIITIVLLLIVSGVTLNAALRR